MCHAEERIYGYAERCSYLVLVCDRIIKVWAVLYTARTRRMHLKEGGREGKEKKGGEKIVIQKVQ